MNKLQGRAALLSILPALFGRKHRSLGALHRPAGRVAFSTLPSSSTRASASKKPATTAAAASQGPITTTMSRCTPEAARGRHVFEIAGYSLVKGLGVGKFIQSGTFSVGGYDWCVQYYPDGTEDSAVGPYYRAHPVCGQEDYFGSYISVFLALLSEDAADVRALCDLRLVDPATGLLPLCYLKKRPVVFSALDRTWGFDKFRVRSQLEDSEYLRDDSLMIQCDISVIKEMQVSPTEPMSEIQVPSPASDLKI